MLQGTTVLIDEQTFKARAAEIADHARNPRGALGEGADFLRGLDETERQRMSINCAVFILGHGHQSYN